MAEQVSKPEEHIALPVPHGWRRVLGGEAKPGDRYLHYGMLAEQRFPWQPVQTFGWDIGDPQVNVFIIRRDKPEAGARPAAVSACVEAYRRVLREEWNLDRANEMLRASVSRLTPEEHSLYAEETTAIDARRDEARAKRP